MPSNSYGKKDCKKNYFIWKDKYVEKRINDIIKCLTDNGIYLGKYYPYTSHNVGKLEIKKIHNHICQGRNKGKKGIGIFLDPSDCGSKNRKIKCDKRACIFENGKWYCRLHRPIKIKEREQKSKNKYDKLLFDLKEPNYSYIIGFIQADGHLIKASRGRGKMSIELSFRDGAILRKIKKIIPVYSYIKTRIRNTNFKKNYKSISLLVCDKNFRDTINYYGIPYGKKSDIIKPPIYDYSENDYWRGIIDGDGSIGFTKDNKPFISLVTASYKLFKSYCNFIYKHIGVKHNPKRNNRDNVYNVILFKEDCKKLISILYYDNCISISRKYKLSKKIIKLKIAPCVNKKWTRQEVKFIMNNSNKKCLLKFTDKKIHNFDNIRTAERKKNK